MKKWNQHNNKKNFRKILVLPDKKLLRGNFWSMHYNLKPLQYKKSFKSKNDKIILRELKKDDKHKRTNVISESSKKAVLNS